MKKWILICLCLIVIVIAVILFLGLSNLGPIVTNAVNTYGPDITKTEVRLQGADISIFSATVDLRDLYLGNPKGFKSPKAMSVGSIRVNVDESTITDDTIIIDSIQVLAPEIVYEKIGNTDNFKAILNNVKKSAKMPEKPAGEESDERNGGKKLLIRDLIVKDGKVNLSVAMLGAEKSISAALPDIHMTDLGKEKEGATPAQIFERVLAFLYEQITSSAVSDILNKELEEYGLTLETLKEDVGKELKTLKKEKEEELKDEVKDKLKSLFD
ncbi:MAG: AsmA family protein [Deltaproteobacteria bacterium]|nr:AsmA family protein [Deltaproteobacteria bacterium]